MQRSQSDDIAWYASHGSGRVIGNLRSNAAVLAYSSTKAEEHHRTILCNGRNREKMELGGWAGFYKRRTISVSRRICREEPEAEAEPVLQFFEGNITWKSILPGTSLNSKPQF